MAGSASEGSLKAGTTCQLGKILGYRIPCTSNYLITRISLPVGCRPCSVRFDVLL